MKISTIVSKVIVTVKAALVSASIKVNAGYKALKDKLGLSENKTFCKVESVAGDIVVTICHLMPLIVIANIIALFPNVAVTVLLALFVRAYFRMAFKSIGAKLVKEAM